MKCVLTFHPIKSSVVYCNCSIKESGKLPNPQWNVLKKLRFQSLIFDSRSHKVPESQSHYMYFNKLEKLSKIQTITHRLRLSEALCFKLEKISSECLYFLYADMKGIRFKIIKLDLFYSLLIDMYQLSKEGWGWK